MIRHSPPIAALHAAAILAICVWSALHWSGVATACCAAYVVGAEVLWRMTAAPIPWESGKYIISLTFVIAALRMGRHAVWRLDALLYFLMLLPSAVLVVGDHHLPLREIMSRLSFNLSGPLSLSTAVWFFSQQRLRSRDMLRICLAALGPILAIAILTIIGTETARELRFTGESNFATSGGFGPNQVSAVLGLGALLALLSAVNRESRGLIRLSCGAFVLLFATQSAMTFSRGGLYAACLSLALGAPLFLREHRIRRILLSLLSVVAIVAMTVVLPRLDEFTHGKLRDRFHDVETTNRVELAQEDLHLWGEHKVLGIGPGMLQDFRTTEVGASGHTEYTRLLAEHGSLGLISLILLAIMSLRVVTASAEPATRGYRIVLVAWALLSMLHAAMRIAAFGFAFGLACAAIQLSTPVNVRSDRGRRLAPV